MASTHFLPTETVATLKLTDGFTEVANVDARVRKGMMMSMTRMRTRRMRVRSRRRKRRRRRHYEFFEFFRTI